MACIKFFFKMTQVAKDGRSKNGHSRLFAIISEEVIDRRLSSMQRERYTSLIIAIKKAFPNQRKRIISSSIQQI